MGGFKRVRVDEKATQRVNLRHHEVDEDESGSEDQDGGNFIRRDEFEFRMWELEQRMEMRLHAEFDNRARELREDIQRHMQETFDARLEELEKRMEDLMAKKLSELSIFITQKIGNDPAKLSEVADRIGQLNVKDVVDAKVQNS